MSSFTEQQDAWLDMYESQLEAGMEHETQEIIQYCKLKSKFASHYREKQKGFDSTNSHMLERARTGDIGEGLTVEVVEEAIRRGTVLHERRMQALGEHFESQWGEPIAGYLEKGGGTGCLILIGLLLGPAIMRMIFT